MQTVVHVTGARPNFPKVGPVMAALAAHGVQQRLIHTGQHYDDRMSDIFFEQLALPRPDVNLGVGSGSHAAQTANIMIALEQEFLAHPPTLVLVYGDINSTVAAALVAAKLQIPMAHVEAGLRSFDMSMPEEVNRRITDQLSELLFVTSPEAIDHLRAEGLGDHAIHFVGNPMIDTLLGSLDKLDADRVRQDFALPDRYAVATLHRPSNVDSPSQVIELVQALHGVAELLPIYIPLHPRGRQNLVDAGIERHPGIHLMEPLGYLEFVAMMRGSSLVLTDSGGVQEETTILGIPCLTMRPNTERPITITHGTNRLVSVQELVAAATQALDPTTPREQRTPPLWDGHAGERIADVVVEWLAAR